ncbi:MAG: UMP kinase [Deltaproteobacteria bacterium]|nr:UMP kinase [Deltaproteobacteria bacterium]
MLLKLSGEALQGSLGFGLDHRTLDSVATQIAEARAAVPELSLAIVVGGGNIFRGAALAREGLNRVTGDHMGMLATVINSLALQDYLERKGLDTRVQSAVPMTAFAEPFIRRRAVRHLEKGRVVIFAAGTGNPFFSTDTAAVLRAVECGAEAVLKATRVDGVYDDDPLKNPEATLYGEIPYMEALKLRLKVLDATALSLAMENRLPTLVFNLNVYGNILKAVRGGKVGTLIYAD